MSDEEKKSVFKDKRAIIIITAILIVVVLVVSFGCYKYYRQVENTVTAESTDYMTEISNRMGINAGKIFQDNFSVLGTIATTISKIDNFDVEAWKSMAQAQQEYWNFTSVMLVGKQGLALDGNGNVITLFKDTFLLDALFNNKASMSAVQNIGGKDSIIFIRPIKKLVVNGVSVVALATSYDLSTFDKVLSLTAFDGKCYAHIINNDGVVVIRSSSPYARDVGYNLLTSLEDAKFSDGVGIEKVKSDISLAQNGITKYQQADSKEYMIYCPLEIEGWTLVSFVPVSVVNQKSQILLRSTLILSSAIAIVFLTLIIALMINFFTHKKKLEQIAYVDPVTGGNTIQKFYLLAKEKLNTYQKERYALLYLNIEKFKIFNEQFGKEACDRILKRLSDSVSENLTEHECLGRLVADNFCALVKFSDIQELVAKLDTWYNSSEANSREKQNAWMPIVLDCGVYIIEDKDISIAHMIDRAKLALAKSAHDVVGKIHYAIYDDKVRKALYREKHLEDIMERALIGEEFKVYLQPKYNSSDEKVSGAEALLRWQNADGMIFPDEFIPLFEKNGFIIKIDMYVFTKVCESIKRWLDEGLEPIKVSVNCSRAHLKDANFVQDYCKIAKVYNVPSKYIEIELTESMMFDDVERIIAIINQIHAAGFGCSMDDFGSGYSSFNLLQEIPVDTIKLDRIFFRQGKDIVRMESVVAGIISMSRSLSMKVVAEGVEQRAHVDMLKRLNCDFIQGYYFAKPMPIIDFEELVYGKKNIEN